MSYGIYYGAGHTVIGPYFPEEVRARVAAQNLMRQSGSPVYEIKAKSYEDARRKLESHLTRQGRSGEGS